MTEHEKSDGLLIGVLVVLVLLVLAAVGVVGIHFLRMSRLASYERVAAEAARQEALRQRDAAEAARAKAEAARASIQNLQVPQISDEKMPPADTRGDSAEPEAKEPSP